MKTQDPMVRYLLGQSGDAERAHIDEQLFADADTLEQLEALETELIDAYVRGELSDDEARAFAERYLASTTGRARVLFARQLIHSGRRRSPVKVYALIGAAAAVLLFVATLAQHSRSAPAPPPEPVQSSRQPDVRQSQPDPVPTVALVLRPDLTRSTNQASAIRAAAGKVLRLTLEHDGPAYPEYRARLRTVEGRTVWESGSLTATRGAPQAVTLDVPAGLLAPADYVVILAARRPPGAFREVDAYTFRVQR